MAQTETGAHRGDASPSRELGERGRGGRLEPGWGLRGWSSPRAAGKGMAPGTGQLLRKPEGNSANCLQASPVCNLWARGDSTGSRRLRLCVPLWITGRGERLSPVGVGMGEGKWAKDDGCELSLFLSSAFPFALHPLPHRISTLHFLLHFPSLCLFFHCFFLPSSPPVLVTSAGCDRVCLAEMSSVNTD